MPKTEKVLVSPVKYVVTLASSIIALLAFGFVWTIVKRLHSFPQDHCFVREGFGLIETPGVFTDFGFIVMPLKKANE